MSDDITVMIVHHPWFGPEFDYESLFNNEYTVGMEFFSFHQTPGVKTQYTVEMTTLKSINIKDKRHHLCHATIFKDGKLIQTYRKRKRDSAASRFSGFIKNRIAKISGIIRVLEESNLATGNRKKPKLLAKFLYTAASNESIADLKILYVDNTQWGDLDIDCLDYLSKRDYHRVVTEKHTYLWVQSADQNDSYWAVSADSK